MSTIIIKGRARWKWRPLFRSRIKSDSLRIAEAMREAEEGDILWFKGNFFITEPFTIRGKAQYYQGGHYYFLCPLLPAALHVMSDIPYGVHIEDIHILPLPSHWQWFTKERKREWEKCQR